jgi:type III pantothenate kinase
VLPDVVVDVGNSRIKWGRCRAGQVQEVVALPAAEAAWQAQLAAWSAESLTCWVLTGVHPPRRQQLADWLQRQGRQVHLLTQVQQLPLVVRLPEPERVGFDRLLNAVAANSRRPAGWSAALVDAGSAVTVDYLDPEGAFCGGAILPGLRLMARVLHEQTALLPLVDVRSPGPAPAPSTRAALETGIFWAVAGGIDALLRQYRQQAKDRLIVFLTGGDAPLLAPYLGPCHLWPEMTLQGICLALTQGEPASRMEGA